MFFYTQSQSFVVIRGEGGLEIIIGGERVRVKTGSMFWVPPVSVPGHAEQHVSLG